MSPKSTLPTTLQRSLFPSPEKAELLLLLNQNGKISGPRGLVVETQVVARHRILVESLDATFN